MATQTPNFKFDLRESADIFNPLSTNANFESLDTILKNLQENGGITTYTTTAAANLLKLSGTPKVNDTVFKFVAAGDANTWTGATGGVINNIVALDGKQVTIKGGNMYVAWVNSANAMVVVAWPSAVDAQTFAGKGPTEWASKAQLDTVNKAAANATQTAQAATTVANNALKTAQAAGFNPELLWTNQNPSTNIENLFVYNLTKDVTEYKYLMFILRTGRNEQDTTIQFTNVPTGVYTEPGGFVSVFGIVYNDSGSTFMRRGFRKGDTNMQLKDDGSAYSSYTSVVNKTGVLIPLRIYGIK